MTLPALRNLAEPLSQVIEIIGGTNLRNLAEPVSQLIEKIGGTSAEAAERVPPIPLRASAPPEGGVRARERRGCLNLRHRPPRASPAPNPAFAIPHLPVRRSTCITHRRTA